MSLMVCIPNAILETPTSPARINRNIKTFFFLENNPKLVITANATLVCPLGKEYVIGQLLESTQVLGILKISFNPWLIVNPIITDNKIKKTNDKKYFLCKTNDKNRDMIDNPIQSLESPKNVMNSQNIIGL